MALNNGEKDSKQSKLTQNWHQMLEWAEKDIKSYYNYTSDVQPLNRDKDIFKDSAQTSRDENDSVLADQ